MVPETQHKLENKNQSSSSPINLAAPPMLFPGPLSTLFFFFFCYEFVFKLANREKKRIQFNFRSRNIFNEFKFLGAN